MTTADVLIAHKSSLAQAITDALYAERPQLLTQYGEIGRVRCLEDMHFNIEHLVPAVALGESQLFARYVVWLRDMLAREMTAAPDSLHVYVAFADGAPAATGWLRFAPGSRFAGLYGGSTLPAFRGRGLYRALVARRIRDARERGYPYAVTDAGPMSRPILERLGFEALTSTTPYFSP